MKQQGEYLTKRVLVRAAKKSIKIASEETMKVMGYNVIALDGWVVKKFRDGTIERIEPIKSSNKSGPVTLD